MFDFQEIQRCSNYGLYPERTTQKIDIYIYKLNISSPEQMGETMKHDSGYGDSIFKPPRGIHPGSPAYARRRHASEVAPGLCAGGWATPHHPTPKSLKVMKTYEKSLEIIVIVAVVLLLLVLIIIIIIIIHQSLIINHQLSIINHQSSIINHQSSIINL